MDAMSTLNHMPLHSDPRMSGRSDAATQQCLAENLLQFRATAELSATYCDGGAASAAAAKKGQEPEKSPLQKQLDILTSQRATLLRQLSSLTPISPTTASGFSTEDKTEELTREQQKIILNSQIAAIEREIIAKTREIKDQAVVKGPPLSGRPAPAGGYRHTRSRIGKKRTSRKQTVIETAAAKGRRTRRRK